MNIRPVLLRSALLIICLLTLLSTRTAVADNDVENARGIVLLPVVLVVIVLAFGAYFLPTIVASARKHRNTTAIFFLNLLLGWSVIGWVGALIWALTNPYSATVVVRPPAQPSQLAPQALRHPCPFCAETYRRRGKGMPFLRKRNYLRTGLLSSDDILNSRACLRL
jgi:uncharacterized membrane-anchored protein